MANMAGCAGACLGALRDRLGLGIEDRAQRPVEMRLERRRALVQRRPEGRIDLVQPTAHARVLRPLPREEEAQLWDPAKPTGAAVHARHLLAGRNGLQLRRHLRRVSTDQRRAMGEVSAPGAGGEADVGQVFVRASRDVARELTGGLAQGVLAPG